MDIMVSNALFDEYASYDWFIELEKLGIDRGSDLVPSLIDILQDSKYIPWALKVVIYSTLRQMAEETAIYKDTMDRIECALPQCATTSMHEIHSRCLVCKACATKYYIELLRTKLKNKHSCLEQNSGEDVSDLDGEHDKENIAR